MSIMVACTGCKGNACPLGSPEQKEYLYYDRPFWFCKTCIGGVSIEEIPGIGTVFTELPLPAYEQPTEESYTSDLSQRV
jgi:hypothetical protein